MAMTGDAAAGCRSKRSWQHIPRSANPSFTNIQADMSHAANHLTAGMTPMRVGLSASGSETGT